jgi:hypothetical protein
MSLGYEPIASFFDMVINLQVPQQTDFFLQNFSNYGLFEVDL